MTSSGNGKWAKRKQDLTISALDDESLVYDPETRRAACLNAFAAEVLARCDGQTSPAEIARDLPFEDVDERVVSLAVADLEKAQLLLAGSTAGAPALAGQSRRAFFKSIGVGTAVVAPAVTAILLPAPASAISVGDCCQIINGNDPCTVLGMVCRSKNPQDPLQNCFEAGCDCTCQPE